jgi:hypothetical protein
VLSRYVAFREAIEVAMAYATRNGSPAETSFGRPRTRMGTDQRLRLPGPLTFEAARRTNATSLYSAPLYGPSLRYLGLLQAADALATDGTSTRIPLASADEQTEAIVAYVEGSLSGSPYFGQVVRLKVPPATGEQLDDLGLHGLHPSFFRQAPASVKGAFLHKFFAADATARRRRLTADLILATVSRRPVQSEEALRRAWYTGLLGPGQPLNLDDRALRDHRARWAVFQARQIQRTILELFLRCFELAVGAGRRSVIDAVDYWISRPSSGGEKALAGTFAEAVRAEARAIHRGAEDLEASRVWNLTVHGDHPSFDDVAHSGDGDELLRAVRMLARWWLRTLAWLRDGVLPDLTGRGQRERLSPRALARRGQARRLRVTLGPRPVAFRPVRKQPPPYPRRTEGALRHQGGSRL